MSNGALPEPMMSDERSSITGAPARASADPTSLGAPGRDAAESDGASPSSPRWRIRLVPASARLAVATTSPISAPARASSAQASDP